ncbi:MAG: hypothetical protein V8S24_11655 [Gordonibacter pamelaeae]
MKGAIITRIRICKERHLKLAIYIVAHHRRLLLISTGEINCQGDSPISSVTKQKQSELTLYWRMAAYAPLTPRAHPLIFTCSFKRRACEV